MACRVAGNAIVCGPPAGIYRRRILFCPVCDRRHRFIERHDGIWYGSTLFGSCGDSWQEGELGYRPFQRGWREKARSEFRAMWGHALTARAYANVRMAESRLYGPHVRSAKQERRAWRRYAIAVEIARRERAA